MSIDLMRAKVVLEPIWRLYSLCMYISMETAVGASAELKTFINVFSTMFYKLWTFARGPISADQACQVSTMAEGYISVQIWKTVIIVSIAQICYKLTKEKLHCKLFGIYKIYIYNIYNIYIYYTYYIYYT